MPGVITVPEFIRETREDYTSPTTSTFVNRIPQCRETINKIDEVRIVKESESIKAGTIPCSVWVSERHKLYNIWACPTLAKSVDSIAHRQHSPPHTTDYRQVSLYQKTCNYNVYIRYPLSTHNTHP